MKKELKNVKYFEQWSMENTNDLDMIIEGKITDFFKNAGKDVVLFFNGLSNNKPVDKIKKALKKPNLLNYIIKMSGYSKDEILNAEKEADNVKWNIDKITDTKNKEIIKYLYELGKHSYETTKAISNSYMEQKLY